MNAIIARFLIIVCLFTFTPFKEVIKAPLLLIHYIEHLQEKSEMSLVDFFDMHYMKGIVLDDDFEKDMQLPFKVVDFAHLPIFVFSESKFFPVSKQVQPCYLKSKLPNTYDFILSDANLRGIFHPPKIS